MRPRIKSITLRGFKTVRELVDFQPGPLSVFIGSNGAGKSNFISFFQMLSWSLASPGQLQEYVSRAGGASRILHDGPETTREIEAEMTLETGVGENQYAFRLVFASGDILIYTQERFRYSSKDLPGQASWQELDAGAREASLISHSQTEGGNKTAPTILSLLRKIIVHQFHNTSQTARIRTKWGKSDNYRLKEDAGNLAAVLLRLKEEHGRYYQRIVDHVRLVLPFFADFELVPEYGSVILGWREKGTDRVFSSSQAADGMLRVFALITLLLQPENDLPDVLILDEPELGLHPCAIKVVGDLLRGVSSKIQVFVATQSVSLLDCFDPGDVVVVDRRGRESCFRRQDAKALEAWLQEYSLSELWEKNVLGGRP